MGMSLKLSALRFIGHQHYIRRGRDRVIRMFHPPDSSPSIPFEVPFFGMRYPGNLNDFIDWSVFMYGGFTPHELYILRDVAVALAKENGAPLSFYDIGANVGQHSLFMSQYVGQVFSFEPFDGVRNKILEKIALNQSKNMTVFPVGLGDVNAELDFFEPSGANHGTGSFVADEELQRRGSEANCPCAGETISSPTTSCPRWTLSKWMLRDLRCAFWRACTSGCNRTGRRF